MLIERSSIAGIAGPSSQPSTASSTGSAAAGSTAAVTFDGAYSGTIKIMNDYDSGFLNTPLDTDGKGFDLEGITVKNEDGKVVTLHGTLHCP